MTPLRVIFCGDRLHAIPKHENSSLILIKGNRCIKAKIKHFRIFMRKPSIQGSVFTLRKCAQSIPRLEKPKNRRFSHKNSKMFDFRFNTQIPSLNQGQGSVFTLRECAQSIFRIKLPLEKSFLQKFKKIFFCKKLLEIFVTKCKKIWFIAVNKIIFLCKKYSEGSWKYFFWILQYHFYITEKKPYQKRIFLAWKQLIQFL